MTFVNLYGYQIKFRKKSPGIVMHEYEQYFTPFNVMDGVPFIMKVVVNFLLSKSETVFVKNLAT